MGSFTQDGVAMGRARRSLRVLLGPLLLVLAAAPNSTESAIANGDTRTLTLSDAHTNESGSFTYKVDGYYDSAVLEKLNWFLRDWRLNESTKMDPKLFDILWQVYRESGSQQPVDILSAYRSPQTNAMLRRRSRQVAEHSQHMEGRAVDAHFLDVGTATIRDITMRMQAGGVGFYPTGGTPWVHIDCGSIRYWPRMSRDALTRLFPDGKTVFIPSDGQPMAGYEQARAEIEARGGEIQTASKGGSGFGFLGFLFGARGGGADDEEETGRRQRRNLGARLSLRQRWNPSRLGGPDGPRRLHEREGQSAARSGLRGARPADAGYPGRPRDREGQSAARPGLHAGRPVDVARPGARARRVGARPADRRGVRYGSGCGSDARFRCTGRLRRSSSRRCRRANRPA